MAEFPQLKTGAICQYPLEHRLEFRTHEVLFADGSSQRHRDWPAAGRAWLLRLDLLFDTELAAIEEFFIAHNGAAGLFEFRDPVSGILFSNCCFDSQSLELAFPDYQRGSTALLIRQRRS